MQRACRASQLPSAQVEAVEVCWVLMRQRFPPELPDRQSQPHSLPFPGGASHWHRILLCVSTLRAEQSFWACLTLTRPADIDVLAQ